MANLKLMRHVESKQERGRQWTIFLTKLVYTDEGMGNMREQLMRSRGES